MSLRREFQLPAEDEEFLNTLGYPWETIVNGGQQWVLIHNFPTLGEYNHSEVTAAIRLESGYPLTALDMVYFFPALARKDGRQIGATNATQKIEEKDFQRWSRHRTGANPWKPGVDNLGSHICLVEDWLLREFEK